MMFQEGEALLSDLPAPGEAVHAIMSGRYDLLVLLAAMLDIHPPRAGRCGSRPSVSARPMPSSCLNSRRTRRSARLVLLCSSFFKGTASSCSRRSATTWPPSRLAGSRPCGRIAKAGLLRFRGRDEAGDREQRANLRTNSNKEQLCVLNDRALHDWYAVWLDRMVSDSQGDGFEIAPNGLTRCSASASTADSSTTCCSTLQNRGGASANGSCGTTSPPPTSCCRTDGAEPRAALGPPSPSGGPCWPDDPSRGRLLDRRPHPQGRGGA